MTNALLDATSAELRDWLQEHGHKGYRSKQIQEWVFQKRAETFEQMSNLPKDLRRMLNDDWQLFTSHVLRESVDEEGTRKLLLSFARGGSVETVLIPQEEKWTVCMSTQVGCGMGCVFCASGLDGVERNLMSGEMLEQLLRLRNSLPADQRISRIVVMGMGEPLANLPALLETLAIATSPAGLGISARNITVSTVGLPTKIRALAEENRPYHLAVSLHAPNDELRRQIVPTAKKTPLKEILAAADDYRQATGRQLTFEYVLLAGINDSSEHARELARLLGRRDAFVNVIPFNPVAGLPYKTPSPETTNEFASILRQAGFAVKIRKRKGSRIDAACGQLRRVVDVSSPGFSGSTNLTRDIVEPQRLVANGEFASHQDSKQVS